MNRRDQAERRQCELMIARVTRQGRSITGRELQIGERVTSNGIGTLAVPAGKTGTVITRYPGEQWKPDMSGWTGQLEWLYSVRWDDREWNNPGNRPAGCSHEMLLPLATMERVA